MAHPDYGAPNARGRALVAKATEWYRHHYGDGPAATDASGKPIDRAPVRRPPAVETPLTAPDGRPVESVGADVIGSFDGLASEAGPVAAAKALQRGLNAALASAGRMAGGRAVPAFLEPLKIDGVLGNKTRSSLRAAAATVPLPSLRRGLAVGAIHGAAEDAGRGDRPRWLRAAAEMAPGGPVALQEGLNAVSRQNGGYPPLELDGWVGPKTEDRFAQTVTAAGPQAVADAFGTRLGFSYRGDDVA
jgi:hypothetical protein